MKQSSSLTVASLIGMALGMGSGIAGDALPYAAENPPEPPQPRKEQSKPTANPRQKPARKYNASCIREEVVQDKNVRPKGRGARIREARARNKK